MAKFQIQVTVKAEVTYSVEVEARNEQEAENMATGRWREEVPEDFQVEKGYITSAECETEKLTADCPECGVEHAIEHFDLRVCHCDQFNDGNRIHQIVDDICVPAAWWHEDQDYCAACGALEEAKEAAHDAAVAKAVAA